MSLQHAANHLAAQGRNGDSMLMHVTPREVSGLQALAQQHGGSLTINPQTGLPEANFLDDIGLGSVNNFAPAIAGFALDTFLPGAGEAAGAMFGLGSTAGTAGIVGGLSALSSGSLEKGIMAGLGAYGGASLSQGLAGAGGNAAVRAAENAIPEGGPISPEATADALNSTSRLDKIGAGISDAFSSPENFGSFLNKNKWAIGAAALPSLMSYADKQNGVDKLQNQGYIRQYKRNPVTGALEQAEAIPVDQFGNRSAVSFGGVGAPVKYAAKGGAVGYASGGITGNHLVYNPSTGGYDTVNAEGNPAGPVAFGGVGQRSNTSSSSDTRSDSQKAYDYLMGKTGSENPMLFYHGNNGSNVENALVPADLNTRIGGHYVLNASGTGYDWVPDAAGSGDGGAANTIGLGGTSGGSSYRAPQEPSAWSNMSPAEQRLSYANMQRDTPILAGVLGFGENLFNSSTLGRALNYLNPEGATQRAFVRGETLSPYTKPALHPEMDGPVSETGGGNPGGGNPGGGNPSSGGPGDGGGGPAATGYTPSFALTSNYGVSTGMAKGGIAALAGGGLGSLGGYSDGGQLLKGPGDGVSDSIPATIGHGQPARLANNEFVIPARIVSELGNGSTDAGAKQLYEMMARIQAGRKKTIGKNKVAVDSKAVRHLPA